MRPDVGYGRRMTDANADSKLHRALTMGIDLVGSGVGGALGVVLGGDAVSSAISSMTGTSIAAVGRDVASRLLSPRQEARIGVVFLHAGASIKAKEVMGRKIREDDFWKGDHSHGSEFAEGVMLTAMDTFEERKIPYLANVLANVATDDGVDPATANLAIRLSRNLSWMEMCIIAIVMRADDFPLPQRTRYVPTGWDEWTVSNAVNQISGDSGLLQYKQPKPTDEEFISGLDLRLSALGLSNSGQLVGGLMQLNEIPADDIRPVHERLLAGTPESQA